MSRRTRPRVMFLGLRGIGGVQGGVETHVDELVRHLPYPAAEMEVIGRRPYRPAGAPDPAQPTVRWLPTLRHPLAETIVHTALGVLYAAWRRPAILHIHAIGPNMVAPLARLMGLRVVATHHGEDYQREKWGGFARRALRFGERQAVLATRACISVSPVVAHSLEHRFGRPVAFIPNGVTALAPAPPGDTLARWGLTRGRFVINVARFVPEKRQLDLIEAFAAARPAGVKLVLVGGADHQSDYARQVMQRAAEVPGIVVAGQLRGLPLRELFWNAGLFALPSSHEGLPIVLLEAMACGLPVLVSDLPVYHAMGLPPDTIVGVGDVPALTERLRATFAGDDAGLPVDWSDLLRRYQWSRIAAETAAVYDHALADHPPAAATGGPQA